jgi:hypothetical protein
MKVNIVINHKAITIIILLLINSYSPYLDFFCHRKVVFMSHVDVSSPHMHFVPKYACDSIASPSTPRHEKDYTWAIHHQQGPMEE